MAVNMMEILKQIQRDLADQKAYMRNLNEKLNFMEEKTTDLPQVLITIGRLEQQLKKNNMLLFGNDETEDNFEDRALVPYKTDPGEKNTDHLVEPSEKCMENTEKTPLQISSRDTEWNNKETKTDDSFQRTDQHEVGKLVTNEIKEDKKMIKEFMEIRNTSVKETATCCRHNAAEISPTYLNTDQINKLDNKLNTITNIYQSDMREIKELIKESIAINKKSIEETLLKQETVKVPSIFFSAEQISRLNAELKLITDTTQSETKEIKELIKNSIAASKLSFQEATELHKQDTVLRETNQSAIREMKELINDLAKKIPVEGAESTVREQKVVTISPSYFSTDQLSKLNSELKRISEMYQDTNIYPVIEVIPGAGEEHQIMKQLCKGVYYPDREQYNRGVIVDHSNFYRVKLGYNGLKRSDVIDMITDYPNLSLNDVVKQWLVASKLWDEWSEKFSLTPFMFYANSGLGKLPNDSPRYVVN